MPSISQLVNRIRQIEFPVLKHELRIGRRKKRYLTRVLVYGTLALTGAIAVLAAYLHLVLTGPFLSARGFSLNRACFGTASSLLLLVISVLVPVFSASTIAGERERGTLDLLAITLLSSSSFVIQKLAVSIAGGISILAASIPAVTVIGLLGGLTPLDIAQTYAVLLATTCFVATGGIFWSCIVLNTGTATFTTYFITAGLYVILPMNPFTTIWGLALGYLQAWVSVLLTLGLSIMGTILLLHFSVQRFEALRCG